jgi:hypothetical protein
MRSSSIWPSSSRSATIATGSSTHPRLTVQFGLGGERPDQRVRLAAIKPSK